MIDPSVVVAPLRHIRWLAQAGSGTILGWPFEVLHCQSWADAIVLRSTPNMSDCFMEQANTLTRILSKFHRDEYRKWNTVVDLTCEILDAEVFPQAYGEMDIRLSSTLNNIDLAFVKNCFRWDIVHYAVEMCYSDIAYNAVYSKVYEIYKLGHMPLGWESYDIDKVLYII